MSTLQVAGYQLTQHVHTNDRVAIFKAIRTADDTRCFLLKPGEAQLRQRDAKEEFVLLSGINSEYVAGAYDLVEDEHTCLVLDDIVGVSLTQSLAMREFSAEQLIQVALRLLTALDDLHVRGILYANFSTDTIFYHRESQSLTLLDFSAAIDTNTQPGLVRQPQLTDSPEQTGLTGRQVDERSDYHGLGVILYKLATGQYPLEYAGNLRDALFNTPPTPVQKLRNELPVTLADLINRLVQPAPEDRPASSVEIRKQLDSSSEVPRDFRPKFYLTQRLRGRDAEMSGLLADLESDAGMVALITGRSGIGKTALAETICMQARMRNMTVVQGKFENEHTDTPYFALGELLAGLAEQLLPTLPQLDELIDELGGSARYLARAFPALANYFDVTETVSEDLSAMENMVSRSVVDLFRLLSVRGLRIVIFLDDLHWMDAASATVLKQLLEESLPHLGFIGGWRRGEVPRDTTLQELVTDIPRLKTVPLAPLTMAGVSELIHDSFGEHADVSESVVQVIFQKTQGYPHFVAQMLGEIVRDGTAIYDVDAARWSINQEPLSHYPPTENVGDILARQIDNYDREFQDALKLAACFGHTISRQMFIDLTTQDSTGLKYFIDRACADGLLVSQRNLLRFAHDRVHQIVYRKLNDTERQRNHERIAALLARYSDRDGVDRTFEIANQYKLYPGIEASPLDFRRHVGASCLAAGEQATQSYAFQAALDYLATGIELLGDQSWHREGELKANLFLLAADAAYLLGDLHRAQTLLGVLIENSDDKLCLANAYRVRMKVFVAQNDVEEAIRSGHLGLKAIGYATPRNISGVRAYLTLRWLLFTFRNRGSFPMKGATGERSAIAHAAVLLFANLISAASRVGDQTIAVYVSRMLKIALNNNDMDEAGSTLCFFAVSVKNFFNDIDEAYRLGKLAQEMSTRQEYALTNTTLLDGMINCWKEPIPDTGERLIAAYRRGIKTEDVEVAITAGLYGASRLFYAGVPLRKIGAIFDEIDRDARRLHQESQVRVEAIYLQAIKNLREEVPEPWHLVGGLLAEDDVTSLDASGKAHFFVLSAYIAMLFDNVSHARECIALTGPNLPGVKGLPLTHTYYFIECLTLIGVTDGEARLKQQLGKLRRAAEVAPFNFAHQVSLVEAEVAATQSNSDAGALFLKAVGEAEDAGVYSDWGFSAERAAIFFDSAGDTRHAADMRRAAKQAYSRWELEAKLHDLI